MNDRIHHRGHSGSRKSAKPFALCPPCLCVLCGKSLFVFILAALLTSTIAAQTQTRQPLPPEKRIRYQIHLALDFENRAYSGSERVRWTNRGEHPTSTLYFHLYPNVRVPGYAPPTEKTPTGQAISDEPSLEIVEVRNAGDNA